MTNNYEDKEGFVGQEYGRSSTTILAGIEHDLMNSTPWRILPDGSKQSVFIPPLIVKSSEGDMDAYRTLLTPIASTAPDSDLREVIQAREMEIGRKTLKGSTGFFLEGKRVRDLRNKGILTYIEPGKIDPQTGLIEPQWRVMLISEEGKIIADNDEALMDLQLNKDPDNPNDMYWYKLGEVNPDHTRTLVFNPFRE